MLLCLPVRLLTFGQVTFVLAGERRGEHTWLHTHTPPQALNNICRFNGVLRVFSSVAMNLGQRQQAKSHNVISYMYSDHGTSVGYLKIKI